MKINLNLNQLNFKSMYLSSDPRTQRVMKTLDWECSDAVKASRADIFERMPS